MCECSCFARQALTVSASFSTKKREQKKHEGAFDSRHAISVSFFIPPPCQPNSLCCLCGASILPNPSNMCVTCIRSQVDITEGLSKSVSVDFFEFFLKFNRRREKN